MEKINNSKRNLEAYLQIFALLGEKPIMICNFFRKIKNSTIQNSQRKIDFHTYSLPSSRKLAVC